MADRALDSRLIARKQEAVAAGGMITCLHPLAAGEAVAVLKAGGNAVDAAVVAGFALGVLEPMMSGIGGGGVMNVRLADGTSVVIEHSPQAPAAATPEAFPLEAGSGVAGFYGWPSVQGNANIVGPRAVAVPGTVAGLAMALERFGTISLAEALAPAIRLAEEGFELDLFTAASIHADVKNLRRFAATAALLVPDGAPLKANVDGFPDRLVQPDLAATMRRIAADGPAAFYQGEIARALVDGLGDDRLLTVEDLAAYEPRVYEGDATAIGAYRGLTIHGSPYEGGAVTTAAILGLLDRFDLGAVGAGSGLAYHLVAETARRAFADRFHYLADHRQVDAPWAELRDPAYLDRRAAEIHLWQATPEVAAGLETSPHIGHTTHLTVMDAQRNAVALTQTHLDMFGSRVIPPGTGVILNNGMMWFDPRPGRANSIAGGKRALTAMSPLILSERGETRLAIGASGGRRILTAIAQVVSHIVDHGMGPQEAVEVPRVHSDGVDTWLDEQASLASQSALLRMGHRLTTQRNTPVGVFFALPNVILNGPHGLLRGGVDTLRPGTARGH
jgi:gamma-glutamyltranspeptidase/glutathione hydrolase